MKIMLLLALLAAPVVAAPDSHTRALAAGYKAAFLCSGLFDAGQHEAAVTADDLTGIYPEYQPLLAELPAVIDRDARRVSVAFDARLPPRIAVWRPLLGCAQLPVGAGPDVAARLPRLTPDLKQPDLAALDASAWPLGDAHATARLPRRPAAALAAVTARAFDGTTYQKGSTTTAMLVVSDGRIVAERYRAGYDLHTPQRTWSVAKSLTASLVGRAVQLGRVDVAAPANIPEWRTPGDPRAAITLEQLLRMNSGLWTNGPGNRTDEVYLGGASIAQTAAVMPIEAAPGSRFRYANDDIMLAAYSLETSLGREALGFPFTQLLWPIGMTRTTPETDWQGHFVLSSQVWTTARDLARLALLYQNDGIAAGQRLLPPDWPGFVSAARGAQPEDTRPGRGGYGAGFWLFGARDGLPEGSYAMLGNRGQYVVIIPAAKLVIVRRGFDQPGAAFDAVALAKDVVAAVARTRN